MTTLKKSVIYMVLLIALVTITWPFAFPLSIQAQETPPDLIRKVEWSDDGRYIAMSRQSGWVEIYNAISGELVRSWQADTLGPTVSLAWKPNSWLLATGGKNGIVRIWNAPIGELVKEFVDNSDFITSVFWSTDGELLGSTSSNNVPANIVIWNYQIGEIVMSTGSSDLVDGLMIQELGLVASAAGAVIEIWDLSSGEFLTNYVIGKISYMDWNPQRQLLAIAVFKGSIHIYDVTQNTQIYLLEDNNTDVSQIKWSSSGRYLAKWARQGDGNIRIWDIDTQQVVEIITGSPEWTVFDWSPDGTKLAIGTEETLQIVDVELYTNTIGNRIWLDSNGNGIQDTGETGMPGLTVHLLNNNFGIVKTAQTNAYGFYTFADLVPDTNYYVQIIPPADTYTIAPVDRGADDTRDSDFDWRDNFGTPDPTDRILISPLIIAFEGMQRDDVDAGLMQP